MRELPDDVLPLLFRHLHPSDLARLARTSTTMHTAVRTGLPSDVPRDTPWSRVLEHVVRRADTHALRMLLEDEPAWLLPSARPLATPEALTQVLRVAAETDQVACAEVLWAHGALLNPPPVDPEQTPLEVACAHGSEAMASWLLEHGAVVRDALREAARANQQECARLLLLRGAHVDGGGGPTPLDVACEHGAADTALVLLEWGAIAQVRTVGLAAMHSPQCLKLLAERRPDALARFLAEVQTQAAPHIQQLEAAAAHNEAVAPECSLL